jgi:riboflavin biosynthesis pyrimidine reductase
LPSSKPSTSGGADAPAHIDSVAPMRFSIEPEFASPDCIAEHVALPATRPAHRAFVRLNMIASADGGSEIAGLSGALGNPDDKAVFAALRAHADAVLVGMSTVVAEHYHAPTSGDLQMFVVATTSDISGDAELFASDQVTLVLPDDAGPAPDGVRTLRSGTDRRVDLASVVESLAGKVVMMEGGPTLAGVMISQGLVDEFFLTIAPRVVAGASARVVHGPGADTDPWDFVHGFVDRPGYLFLRYARPVAAAARS